VFFRHHLSCEYDACWLAEKQTSILCGGKEPRHRAKEHEADEHREVGDTGGDTADANHETNKDLRLLIQKDLFPEDLYCRLCVINLHVLSLRERSGDVALLIEPPLTQPPKSFPSVELRGDPGCAFLAALAVDTELHPRNESAQGPSE